MKGNLNRRDIYRKTNVHKTGKYTWAVLYAILLTSFTVYAILDTFVIARVYSVIPSNESDNPAVTPDEAEVSPAADNAVITDSTYRDRNISITISRYREYETDIYVADIILSDAGYLKTAFAQGLYGRNITEKTSSIAAANQAILAVNGDYYGARTVGYVLRNGVLFREAASEGREDLVVWADGSLEVITEDGVSASQLKEEGALQILSFGPGLVVDGTISVSEGYEVDKAMTSNPRTAIGRIDGLHYIFLVSDGRTSESEGLTLYELAAFMSGLGAATAYNLDGGGSSTMYFNGEVVNNPTTNGKSIKERSVSDIVYIGY